MEVFQNPSELKGKAGRFCVAIGFFDGVHLGHQQILHQTIADAEVHGAASLVVTFDRHPATVVAPERAPRLIYPKWKRTSVIRGEGVDYLLEIPFDKEFSQKTGEEFISYLQTGLGNLNSICVGGLFSFGKGRSGNVSLLKDLGQRDGFNVHGLSAVALDGESVSSTRIRGVIEHGEFDAASQMLGRGYSLCGEVIKGDQVGRQLGFPTANLSIEGMRTPPHGVYAVRVKVEGETHCAVFNLGMRPTLQSPTPSLHAEAHLLDFEGDLYGKRIEVSFLEKLREEMRFSGLDELKQQIGQDIEQAKTLF